jgi:hypothetical protein
VDFLAGTLWAFELAFVVLFESQDEFERFLAIITIKLVARHSEPPRKAGPGMYSVCTPEAGSCQGAPERMTLRQWGFPDSGSIHRIRDEGTAQIHLTLGNGKGYKAKGSSFFV